MENSIEIIKERRIVLDDYYAKKREKLKQLYGNKKFNAIERNYNNRIREEKMVMDEYYEEKKIKEKIKEEY